MKKFPEMPVENPKMRGLTTIINEKELKYAFPEGSSVDENLIVGLNDSDDSKFVKGEALNIIENSENNNITFIIGKPGAGKSTMLYIIGRMLLNNGKNICKIDDLGSASFGYATKNSPENYYILFDINDIQIAKAFNDRINQINNHNYSKIIVSVRESYINPNTVTKYKTYPIEYNNEVIGSIARKRIKELGFSNTEEQEECISSLVPKAEGIPSYISEAVKYISEQKNNCKMLALPTGIKELTKFILTEEYKRDKRNIIIYNLVASYSYVPKRLIDISCFILGINDENLPKYFDNISSRYYRLHSWYRETLENFDIKELGSNSDNLPNLSGLKEALKDVNSHLNSIEDDRLKGVRNDLNQFLDNILLGMSFNDTLRDITDALLLASLIRYSHRYLKTVGKKYGYNIIKDDIEYSKLFPEESVECYYEIVGFTLTEVFSNVTEYDFKERTILPLMVLYSSRFYVKNFSLVIGNLISDKKPDINEDTLMHSVIDEEYPFINYIHAASYWLHYAKLIDSLTSGGFYILIGKLEDAAKEYDKAIKLKPNELINYYFKGNVLYDLGKKEEALAEFDKAIKLKPNEPYYHSGKGIALSDLGKKEEALAEFDKAIKLNPDNPDYHSNKGCTLSELGKKEEALDEYDTAIKLKPNEPYYHNNKGNVLYDLKRDEEALDEIDKAIKLNPDNPNYHYNKGNVLVDLKKYENALDEFDKAIKLDSNTPTYYYNKGIVLYDLKRDEEALDEIDKAIKLNPDNPTYYDFKGNVLYELGENSEASVEHEKAKIPSK